jgi:hypothetical protein
VRFSISGELYNPSIPLKRTTSGPATVEAYPVGAPQRRGKAPGASKFHN